MPYGLKWDWLIGLVEGKDEEEKEEE